MIEKKIAVDSTVLLRGAEGVADSAILTGFRSMIEAEAVTRARAVGYTVRPEYCHVGEFGIDIIGETAPAPFRLPDGSYLPEGVRGVMSGEYAALLSVDTNGFPERSAAVSGLINVKPTFGTVSRYGIVPVATSLDTVTVTASTARECREVLAAISGRDEKDPQTVASALCPMKNGEDSGCIRRVGVPREVVRKSDPEVRRGVIALLSALDRAGVEIVEIPKESCKLFSIAHAARNVILCAELRGNLSRYDGVRYGKPAYECSDLSELYTRTRSEGFGELVKLSLLYGSYVLSPDGGEMGFSEASRIRDWVRGEVKSLYSELGIEGMIIPATTALFYTEDNVKTRRFTAFSENFYTAIPSLCGLPSLTLDGIQIVGARFSEGALLSLAEQWAAASRR